MEKKKSLMLAAVLCCGIGLLASCTGNGKASVPVDDEAAAAAVAQYMVDSIAPQYSPGEVSIPSIAVIGFDSTNPDSVKVWGDYWVFNYNIVGDTLKCVSGGSHPGMMCLRPSGDGYEVIAFDRVGDGSDFEPSARRIYSHLYDQFLAINGDQERREEVRVSYIADYVKANHVPVYYYQDYGWPARKIFEQ